MAKRSYSVICQSIMGNPEGGYSCVYGMDSERFPTREEAIRHGFTFDRSDDFNIGVWDGRNLVSIDWMEKVVDDDPALLREIQINGELPV